MGEKVMKRFAELLNLEFLRLMVIGFGLGGASVFYFGYFVSTEYGAPKLEWPAFMGILNILLFAFPLLTTIGLFLAKRDFRFLKFLIILGGSLIGTIGGLAIALFLILLLPISIYGVPILIGFSSGAAIILLISRRSLFSVLPILFGMAGIACVLWLLLGIKLIRGEGGLFLIVGAGCALGASLLGTLFSEYFVLASNDKT